MLVKNDLFITILTAIQVTITNSLLYHQLYYYISYESLSLWASVFRPSLSLSPSCSQSIDYWLVFRASSFSLRPVVSSLSLSLSLSLFGASGQASLSLSRALSAPEQLEAQRQQHAGPETQGPGPALPPDTWNVLDSALQQIQGQYCIIITSYCLSHVT